MKSAVLAGLWWGVLHATSSWGAIPSVLPPACQERLAELTAYALGAVRPVAKTIYLFRPDGNRSATHPSYKTAAELDAALTRELPLAVVTYGDPLSADLAPLVDKYRWHVPFLHAGQPDRLEPLAYARLLEGGYHRVVDATLAIETPAGEAAAVYARQCTEYRELALRFARHGMAMASPVMLEACARATNAGASRKNVLILGATGVGKERIARAIHDGDPGAAEKPFVVVNSATLQASLAESLLFGHEKGSFTGANGPTVGHFREANGGTLVFDEVQNLSLEVQAKLLRVLQEGRARSVGGKEDYPLDVRVIAISNRPLREMVEKGEFREDLFHRLGVVVLEITPLRDRPADLVLQAKFFLRLFQGENAVLTDLSPVVVAALRMYRWPGNSRELENVIQESLPRHSGTDTTLQFEDLPPWFRRALLAQEAAPAATTSPTITPGVRTLDEVRRETIRAALARHPNNQKQAAEELGISRSTLARAIKELGLD